MKAYVAAIIAAVFFATPATANIQGGDVDLPETPVVKVDAGNGKHCVLSWFPGKMQVIELVENYQTIAAATFIDGQPISAREPALLLQWCGNKK